VTMDGAGNFYGVAGGGGANGYGTVWEIAKGTNTITALASFHGSNGFYPWAGVTIGGSGGTRGSAGT